MWVFITSLSLKLVHLFKRELVGQRKLKDIHWYVFSDSNASVCRAVKTFTMCHMDTDTFRRWFHILVIFRNRLLQPRLCMSMSRCRLQNTFQTRWRNMNLFVYHIKLYPPLTEVWPMLLHFFFRFPLRPNVYCEKYWNNNYNERIAWPRNKIE